MDQKQDGGSQAADGAEAAKRKRAARAQATVKRRIAKHKAEFLEHLRSEHDVRRACKRTGISNQQVYLWRERDPAFAKGWEFALKVYVDDLKASAFRRAAEGSIKPIYQGGEKVGEVREFETALTIFLLKKLERDVFGDDARQIEGMSPEEYARRAREAVLAMEAATVQRVRAPVAEAQTEPAAIPPPVSAVISPDPGAAP